MTDPDAPVISKALRLILEGIGRPEETAYYLHKFSRSDGGPFCIVCPTADCIADEASPLAFDLNFLRRIDLNPLVLLAGPKAASMHESLKSAGLSDEVTVELDSDKSALENLLSRPDSELQRVHLLTLSGKLHGLDDHPFDLVHLKLAPDLRKGDLEALAFAQGVIQRLPSAHVSITSAMDLLRELFTIKGAGTLVKPGSEFRRETDMENIDRTALENLMENAFGKTIDLRSVLANTTLAILESESKAAALIEATEHGDYLSKFAVGREMQGLGLAQELWDQVTAAQPGFFWRCRPNNRIARWYLREADGWQRSDSWMVFWRGLPPEKIPGVIHYALERPGDFDEPER